MTPEKQYENRRERVSTSFYHDSSQSDRFNNEYPSNRPNKDKLYNKYNKSEMDNFNKGDRVPFRANRNKFSGNESRYNRNNNDTAWSDKDLDISSKGHARYEKDTFNRGGRGGRRDSGISNRLQTTKWNGKNSDRFNYKNEKVDGNLILEFYMQFRYSKFINYFLYFPEFFEI